MPNHPAPVATPTQTETTDKCRTDVATESAYGARIVRSLGAGALGYAISIVAQLVSVPLFLHCWGIELYGEWLLLSIIPAYIAMSDIGFGSIAGTEMTLLFAAGEKTKALKVFQSTWTLISGISLLLLLSIAVVLPVVDVRHWLHIALMTRAEVVTVVMLLALYVLVGQQSVLLAAGFRCEGRFAVGMMWSNLARFLELLAVAGGLIVGATTVEIAAVMVGVRVCATVLMRVHLLHLSPWLTVGSRYARFAIVRRLAGPAVAYMAFPLGNALRNQGVLMVIGIILGPVAVVLFATTRTLTNLAFQAMSIINSSVWPELSTAFGARDMEMARKLHRNSCQASFWLSLVAVAGLSFLGPRAYRLWTGASIAFDNRLFYILLMVIVVNSLWYTSSTVSLATNSHQRMAVCYLLGTAIAVGLADPLIRLLGLAGAGLSLLAIDVLMVFSVLPHSLRLVKDRLGGFACSVLGLPTFGVLSWIRKSL